MIYYFTGQPGSGKTTLAKLLIKELEIRNAKLKSIFHIDGDDMRVIFQNIDYSANGRKVNIERAHDFARFLNEKKCDVVISLVSPYKELRDNFKKLNFPVKEIYTHTSEIRGRENYFVDYYEPPTDNFIDADTTSIDPMEIINKIFI